MPQTVLFMRDYLVRPSGWKDCDPNMSRDTHQHHVSSKMIPGRLRMHARSLHSLNSCLITSSEISTGLRDIFFVPYFFLLPTQFLWWVCEDLSCTLSLPPPPHSLFTRQILREVDVKTRQSKDVKNINTFFFYCPEGKRGEPGVGRWGL